MMNIQKTLLVLGLGVIITGASYLIWQNPAIRGPQAQTAGRGVAARPGRPRSTPDAVRLQSPRDMKLTLDAREQEELRRLVGQRARAVEAGALAKLPREAKVLAPLRMSRQEGQSESPGPAEPSPGSPATASLALPTGYHPEVFVSAPGRLDWTFVSSRHSLDPEPAQLTRNYAAADQSYELFVPPGDESGQVYPLILHVPTGPMSDGWGLWEQVCRRHGVMLAGVHRAGNGDNIERPGRMRTVLDVLDDLRRRFRIDPDRTYITGCSGAGNAASRIAFALPELFGGVVTICGTWSLRRPPWLRQRVAERLSVAVLTGEFDFNRPELELEFFPIIREHGGRASLHVYPGIGHATPGPDQLNKIYEWLEAGLAQRRQLAAQFPASRQETPLSADKWSAALLREAGARLHSQDGLAAGLFLLQGVADRWNRSPPADFAKALLEEFDKHSRIPWKDIYQSENLRFVYLEAQAYDAGWAPPPPPGYPVSQVLRRRIAVELWDNVLGLAPAGGDVAREARARLGALKKPAGR